MRKVTNGVLALLLAITTIVGSSCGGRNPAAYYVVPAVIGAGAGIGGALLLGSWAMNNQGKMMKSQEAMLLSQQDLQSQQQTDRICTEIFNEILGAKIGSAASTAAEARYEARGCTSKPR